MKYSRIHGRAGGILVSAAAAALATAMLAGPVAAQTAASSALLYKYEFAGTKGTVSNSASGGPAVTLTLDGSWSSVSGGVHFAGNTTGSESVAYGKPSSGYTLDEPSSAAIGVGTKIVYDQPATGTCFTGTPNVTQIGRAGPGKGQAKIQLSDCTTNKTQVMAECRFAGANTPANAPLVVSTAALVNDDTYNITCVKSPDSGSGTVVTLAVDNLTTNKTVTTTGTETAMGAVETKEYISAGNRYPLPSDADNTSQFVGNMDSTIYCAGTSSAVSSCLSANLPS